MRSRDWLVERKQAVERGMGHRKQCHSDLEDLPAYLYKLQTRLRIYPHAEQIHHWTKWDKFYEIRDGRIEYKDN